MANTDFKSVDEYIASQPKASQGVLERVRGAIRKAAPDAKEVISYQIAAYKLPSGPVLFFAGWSDHYSLYPATDRVIAEFKDDLAEYEIRKRTMRFPLSKPVPVRLIARIAKFRAQEIAESSKTKSAAPKKHQAPTMKRAR